MCLQRGHAWGALYWLQLLLLKPYVALLQRLRSSCCTCGGSTPLCCWCCDNGEAVPILAET